MSVHDGQRADANNFNNAFFSKVTNSIGVAVYTLSNPASGAQVSNIQKQINDDIAAIAQNVTDIATNATDIATNVNDISNNANAIATNVTNIATNAGDIAAIDTRVTTLESSSVNDNLSAVIDPVAGDDSSIGYSVGSTWINVSNAKIFKAVDVSVGAAIWKRIDKPMLKINNTYFNNNFTADNVSWTELVADSGAAALKQMQIFYTTGSVAQIAIGALGSETEVFVLQSGGGTFDVDIPANSRISFRVKGTESDITSGIKLAINFLVEA